MLLRVALPAIALTLTAAFAWPSVSEKHSRAYRYLQAHQRPESVALCRGPLPPWGLFQGGGTLEPVLVGFVPEHDPALFKREARAALRVSGYEVTQEASAASGDTWYLQLRHRLRGDERVLLLRHNRSGLKVSHWCYFKPGAGDREYGA